MQIKTLAAIFAACSLCYAGELTSTSQLVSELGTPGTTYDFGTFSVAAGTSAAIGCAVLTVTSVCSGQGPGLVPQGVEFSFGGGGGQWDGVGYLGSTSQEILSGSAPSTLLTITFTTLTTGVALDMRAFAGYGATATVLIFGLDDTTVIGTISNIDLNSDGSNSFAGWEDFAGIGKVELTQTGQSWSPILDFLEYGAAHDPPPGVPEPASFLCVGLGLGALALYRRH